jgi:plastocyanin
MIQAAILALALCAGTSVKGKVTVHKADGSLKAEASDVVVFVADVSEPVKGVKAAIKQHNRQFEPRVLAVAQGTEVSFPNEDTIKHNVFSHSKIIDFDLGLFAKDEQNKSKEFEKPGFAEIYCDVHPDMIAYVVVAPSKLFAITGKDGAFELKGVAAGKHKLTIWERFANPKVKTIEIDVAEGAAALELTVDENVSSDDPHKDKRGMDYKGDREHDPHYR